MSQHQAAFITEVNKQLEVKSIPTPALSGPNDVQIRTKVVAINPVDNFVQATGQFVKSLPAIVGSDIAGEVIAVGDSVTTIKKGDRVLGAPTALVTSNQAQAGYQEIVTLPLSAVCKIPESVSYEEAAVLPLSVSTVAAGFYNKDILNLPLPTAGTKSTGKKILIWGASGSVGSSAVQLAIANGLEVVATASPKNFDYVKSLGGKNGKVTVLDYRSPGVVGDLVDALQGEVVGAYDAVGDRDTQLAIGTVLAQLGGGKFATVREATDELPANVNATMVLAPLIFLGEQQYIGDGLFGSFLPEALANGSFKPAPSHEVVGSGWESVQKAMDLLAKGVSAKKLVVTV